MVRPPEKVLTLPRRLRRASNALLGLMLSASSPGRDRRVVVTISERFGKAIAYPIGLGPLFLPERTDRRQDGIPHTCLLARLSGRTRSQRGPCRRRYGSSLRPAYFLGVFCGGLLFGFGALFLG